eukprot:Skav220250  [mRNA]  locus=scaffold1696:13726:21683:+ [translate_table: standard]
MQPSKDGCVGHFAAAHLAQQANLSWAIAGNRSHLDAVLAALTHVTSKPEVVVAALDNQSDPKTWLKDTRAVITAAGPFSLHGGREVLLRAAAELGVHYADTSDEHLGRHDGPLDDLSGLVGYHEIMGTLFYWQRWMIDRYDALAQSSGAKAEIATEEQWS